jgi:cell division control protein 45
MYELAQQLNKDSNQILWLAVVGATEKFLFQQSDMDAYNELVAFYQQEVEHLTRTNQCCVY